MKFKNLIVRLCKKEDYSSTFDLTFDLIDSAFLPKWVDRLLHAQHRQDPISEPGAFYNLNDQWTEEYTIDFLNKHIDICNSIHPGMFNRRLTSINDQDTLNYIHSIFEMHHGKLDSWLKNKTFNTDSGDSLVKSLSNINQTVHHCEGLGSNPKMRIVYFDLPKTKTFTNEDYALFTDDVDFGGVYTCYADVGKHLEALATDEDDHHHDFVPHIHYSADFYIRFHNTDGSVRKAKYNKYYKDNLDYFTNKGYELNDIRLTTGEIKLAQLQYSNEQDILNEISKYDSIQSVIII